MRSFFLYFTIFLVACSEASIKQPESIRTYETLDGGKMFSLKLSGNNDECLKTVTVVVRNLSDQSIYIPSHFLNLTNSYNNIFHIYGSRSKSKYRNIVDFNYLEVLETFPEESAVLRLKPKGEISIRYDIKKMYSFFVGKNYTIFTEIYVYTEDMKKRYRVESNEINAFFSDKCLLSKINESE
ncbi:MAG: hypothetical protein ACRBCS_10670 [Cellvibrionaceae bacterium]